MTEPSGDPTSDPTSAPTSARTSAPASDREPATVDDATRALGLVAALGFVVLVVLLVLLVVTEENLVGTAAGIVGIVTGVCLGIFLRRSEPAPADDTDAPARS